MNSSDITRVQTYLRKLLGSEKVTVVAPPRKGATVELAIDSAVVTGFLAWLEARPPGATLPP